MVVAVLNALAYKDFHLDLDLLNSPVVLQRARFDVCFSLLEGPFTSFKFHF